jgi:hypothetical protein
MMMASGCVPNSQKKFIFLRGKPSQHLVGR